MATQIKNGQSVSSVAVDTELNLVDNFDNVPYRYVTVTLEIESGSVQFSVGEIVNSSHRIYSSAGDKTVRTVNNSVLGSLHCKGVGVFTIAW